MDRWELYRVMLMSKRRYKNVKAYVEELSSHCSCDWDLRKERVMSVLLLTHLTVTHTVSPALKHYLYLRLHFYICVSKQVSLLLFSLFFFLAGDDISTAPLVAPSKKEEIIKFYVCCCLAEIDGGTRKQKTAVEWQPQVCHMKTGLTYEQFNILWDFYERFYEHSQVKNGFILILKRKITLPHLGIQALYNIMRNGTNSDTPVLAPTVEIGYTVCCTEHTSGCTLQWQKLQ